MFDPLNMPGPEFLKFYGYTVLIVSGIAIAMRHVLLRDRESDVAIQNDAKLTPDEVAMLAGGPRGLADSALAALVNCGAVKLAGRAFKRQHAMPKNASIVDPVIDHEVALAGDDGATLKKIRKAVIESNEANSVLSALKDRGLLLHDSKKLLARWLPTGLILLSLMLCAGKLAIGISRNKPVVWLIALGIVQFAVMLFILARAPLRTQRGEKELQKIRDANAAMEHAGARGLEAMSARQVQLAVALFGAVMLTGTLAGMAPLMRDSSQSYSGFSCSSGSSCGGGDSGGGGGCGGCGGGGGD